MPLLQALERMRRPIAAAATCVLTTAASIPVAAHAQAKADARELYHQYCSVCHGDRGDGRSRARQGLIPAPRDFTAPDAAGVMTRQRMIEVVLHGRPGTAMTGWSTRLSRAEAEAVVDYIRSDFMRAPGMASAPGGSDKRALASAAPTRTAKGTRVRGDFAAGKALYQANCATCHGVNGLGDGPRAYFIFPKPRNFTDAASRAALHRERLFEAVSDGVRGREMPAWRTVLSARQIADVSEYVYGAFVRPTPGLVRKE